MSLHRQMASLADGLCGAHRPGQRAGIETRGPPLPRNSLRSAVCLGSPGVIEREVFPSAKALGCVPGRLAMPYQYDPGHS
jgi:hypothetical protein